MRVPRTIASARASGASRRPSRRPSADRSASRTSRCSSGDGVWLSKGRTATVFTCAGSPPPAKPYGKQPTSSTHNALMTPDRRIEGRSSLSSGDVERQQALRQRALVAYGAALAPLHRLDEPPVLDALESRET